MKYTHLIYRAKLNEEQRIVSVKPLEYSSDGDDAHKYARLFDLQTPADMKGKIIHKVYRAEHYA